MSSISRRISVIAAVVAVLSVATPAAAVAVPFSATPLDTYNVKGTVYATTVVGNTVYVGGAFTGVRHNGINYAYNNLAAFDAVTGELRAAFAPQPNFSVRAIVSDGNSLYVGGRFTIIGGLNKRRVARLNLTTGAAFSGFNASAGAEVSALALGQGRVYAGGQFLTAGGVERKRLAAFNDGSGVLSPWNPGAGGNVKALAMMPDEQSIIVGGSFDAIADTTRTKLARLATTSNTTFGPDIQLAGDNVASVDLHDNALTLYAGSESNELRAYRLSDGVRLWRNAIFRGDIQATHYAAGNVYVGFHDSARGMVDARLAAVDATTGVAVVSWNPQFQSTYGVFAVTSTANRLIAGGEFWDVNGVAQDGVALFPLVP